LVVALADRLDSLAGLFAASLAPTGTKDPFGLRRAAIGLVQPLIEHDIDFDLCVALKSAAALEPVPVTGQVQSQVLDFINSRLRVVLMDMGFKHDVVDAVLVAQAENPAGAARAIRQLTAWVARPDWSTILSGYARCVRITRDQKKKLPVKPDAFIEAEEKILFAALEKAEKRKRVPGSVDDFLAAFFPMLPTVTGFFDKVLVMTEDRSVQENRLGLLQRIASLADGCADFGKLDGF
jgi:glycyl-tRNA synthetase